MNSFLSAVKLAFFIEMKHFGIKYSEKIKAIVALCLVNRRLNRVVMEELTFFWKKRIW